jgi:predicted transcriptional regulator of viral defense system/very-short-patch-repair endonuclease
MGAKTVQSTAARAWALAKRDHDVVTRQELLGLGFTSKAIQHRLRRGRLHRKAPGVYAIGSPNLTPLQRLMVAIKRCGPGAVLSHLSAAVLWGLWKREPARIQVSVPAARNPRPSGVRVSRREAIAATRHRGIPVTTVLQTLIDCAPGRSRAELERMINHADSRDLLHVRDLHAGVRGRSEPGAVLICGILDQDAFVLTDSEAEQLLVPIAVRAGLGKPLTQHEIAGYRVDFHWPEHALVVEVDGLRYHRTPLQQRRDLQREHALAKLQIVCRRFSYWQLAKEPAYVEGVLRPPARTPDRPRAA